jgi:putative tricarboxylic transport membrane protein
MIASFFAASFGIVVIIFASPLRVQMACKFGPTEIFSIMLLGSLAGPTMSRGSALKGVAMTAVALMVFGTDAKTGVSRFTFIELSDKVELVALASGIFGVAEFRLA